MNPVVPISWGELIDKITILEIKSERIVDELKLVYVRKELALLQAAARNAGRLPAGCGELVAELKAINAQLWDIEDQIRDHEKSEDFGRRFIELARDVYRTNDRRARVKREISRIMGSDLMEEKSYGGT